MNTLDVGSEVGPLGECGGTGLAGVGFLASVAAHVGGQFATVDKALSALIALELFIVLIVLLPLVFADSYLVSKRLAAHVAGH